MEVNKKEECLCSPHRVCLKCVHDLLIHWDVATALVCHNCYINAEGVNCETCSWTQTNCTDHIYRVMLNPVTLNVLYKMFREIHPNSFVRLVHLDSAIRRLMKKDLEEVKSVIWSKIIWALRPLPFCL